MATEQSMLRDLGITDTQIQNDIISGNKRLVILDASAHLDWDWLLPNPVLVTGGKNNRSSSYFKGPGVAAPNDPGVGWVNQILEQAIGMLNNTAYHYSICEMGFLRAFAITNPENFKKLVTDWIYNVTVSFPGGGITSPDNLLPHGEAIIRNYLVGHTWLTGGLNADPGIKTCWIPDDFGHDPQLPVVLQAMGLIAAGFERIPGYPGRSWVNPVSGAPNLAKQLTADKIDFTWTASDGSSIIAHWLIGGYGQGNDIASSSDISTYLSTNTVPSPTPYIYVPVLSDFSLPNPNLLIAVQSWNGQPGVSNVIAACGSFENYAQLLQFHTDKLNTAYGNQFNANPYYTGCYGSRPELKILHQRATRNLLAAETFSIIAGWAQPGGGTGTLGIGISWAQSLDEAWDLLVPSTHHDYITGTGIPDVYHTEQITLLQQADDRAKWLLDEAMQTIAGAINTANYSNSVVVFNPLGFQRTGIAELDAESVANGNITVTGAGYQATADGGLLFQATVPSLGYQTVNLSNASAPANPASVSPINPVKGQAVIMKNDLLTATLKQDPNGIWGLVSVIDATSGNELIKQGFVANSLQFFADGGDEYRFGMEVEDGPAWTLTDVGSNIKSNSIAIIETGPLRVVVRTIMNYNDGQFNINYTFDYILYAGEPMLRMKASGAAPMLTATNTYKGTSVVLSFPLNTQNGIDSIIRGTPYHWTDVMNIYWNEQTFLPTHHFVVPVANNNALCAIYHSDIPGWGLNNQWNGTVFTNDGVLYGCAWRNGDGNYFYTWVDEFKQAIPWGTDPAVHVHEYALRIPTGLQPASTGQPLQESMAMTTMLKAKLVSPWTGALDQQASLVSSTNNAAIITTAKQGAVNVNDIIFRVYQPTNGTLTTTLKLSPYYTGPVSAKGQTALEQGLSPDNETKLNLAVTGNDITITMNNALATIAVTL